MNISNKGLPKVSDILNNLMPNYCDKCGTRHSQQDLEVLSNDSNKTLFKLHCKKCSNSYMIQVQNPGQGVLEARRMPFNTDVNSEEFSKFAESKKIETNEILDVYSSIEKIKDISDFDKLFDSKDNPRSGIK